MDELGADRMLAATLEQKRYNAAKYKASVRHALHGTVLDWRVAVGKAARLGDGDIDFLTELPAALLHVNHVYTLGFALKLHRKVFGSSLPIILETHDVQSHVLHDWGDRNPWTGRPDRLDRLIKSEAGLLQKANVLVHLSVDDFEFFRALIPSKPHFLAFPAIEEHFCSAFSASTAPAESIDLLFVGQWQRYNFEAVKWFLEQVWPLVADRRYNLKIVGNIESMVRSNLPQLYEAFRSCFVGEVPDLIPYYRAARCVIAPMVSGSGISIKTMEALALGKPFVGTSKAFRGMPMDRLKAAGIEVHDGAKGFADAIVRTLHGEQEAQERSRAAYDNVFSARASFAVRDEALRAATTSPKATPLLRRLTHRAMNILEGSK
jgi:glycosyltransferase involved in cell wall biosynthesis